MSTAKLSSDLHALFDGLNSGVIILDQNSQVICWNDWMNQHSTLKAKKVLGQTFDDLFPELLNQRVHLAILNNLKLGLPATISNILNKAPFPLHILGKESNALIEQQLNISRINLESTFTSPFCLINITDVSAARIREKALENQVKERKKTEQQLLKKTHQLQSALSVSNAGIFRFDLISQQLFLDQKASEIFKIEPHPDHNVFEQWCTKIHPDDLTCVVEQLKKTIDNSVDFSLDFEFRIKSAESEIQWVELKGIVGIDSFNQNKTINGVLVDISRQKTHQDLLRQKEAAEIANKAKSAFLANMSHELRTPMHGILSFSNLGMRRIETSSKEKLEVYFSRIKESGERLLHLLNDLLDLSKLEAGKMEFNFTKTDLKTLVDQVINEQSARMHDLDITTECSFQAGETIAEFDNVRITQVLLNFLSNAIKYTPQHCKIIFSIQQHSDSLELMIIDQGAGIPENELEFIFEKFQQSSETEDGSGGTGLGLAICKEIIEGHHGEIGARNNPEGGANFYFKIPLNQDSTTKD